MRQLNDEYLRQRASGDTIAGWDFRLVLPDGKVYTLPPGAVTHRSRAGRVDDGSWNLKLTLDLTRLPAGTDPLQYHGVEVYRLVAGVAEPIPYFTGVIDVPDDSSQYAEGAAEHERVLDCYGVLYKAKGYRLDTTYFTPAYASITIPQLTGICKTNRGTIESAGSAGLIESFPGPAVVPLGVNQGLVKVFQNPDYSTGAYTAGTQFTVDETLMDPKLHWAGGVTPVSPRFVQWVTVDRWVVLRAQLAGYTVPNFLVMPFGRDPNDLYATTVTGVDIITKTIAVADPTPFLPGNSLLDVAQGEWITADRDGSHFTAQITGVNADGTFTVDVMPINVQVGDLIWLSTTDSFQAWDDNYLPDYYWFSTATSSFSYALNTFKSEPKVGMALPAVPKFWLTSDGVWARNLRPIDEDDEINWVEAAAAGLLLSTGLFSPEAITYGYSGAFMRNALWLGKNVDEILAEMKEQSLPPWSFAHDHPDGSVSIKPYRQQDEPQWTLTHVESLDEEPLPEPVTAVLIVAEGAERNVAKECFVSAFNSANPSRIVDGRRDLVSNQADYTFIGGVMKSHGAIFDLRPITPLEAYPDISRVVVHAQGTMRATMQVGPSTTLFVDGTDWVRLGDTAGAPTAYEITKQALERVMPRALISGQANLILDLKENPNGFAEVEVFTKVTGAWRSQLTDDAGYSLSLGGGSHVAKVSYDAALLSVPFTVEAWVKTSVNDATVRSIVSMYASGSQNGWMMYLINGRLNAIYYKDASNHIKMDSASTDGGPIADGKWHHVAFTVSNSQGRLYVDGRLVRTVRWTGTAGLPTTTQDLRIGNHNTANGFNGSIHEVRLWSEERSPEAIRHFMAQRLTGMEAQLRGYWPLNEVSGTTALDAAAGRHASLLNGAAFTKTGDRRMQWADADQGLEAMGTVWRSPDPDRRESWRFAPTSLLQRISPKYWFRGSMRSRLYERRLDGISQLDCRNFAEDYQDEFLRLGKTYIATAPLDDRAELGDTVRVFHPRTGEELQLLLWALDDSGAPGDVDMARYELIDYGR